MNFLRRRNAGTNSSASKKSTVSPKTPSNGHTDYSILPDQNLKDLTAKPKSSKRRTVWIFGLGGLFGLVVAAMFANQNDMLDFAALQDINLESIADVLPAGVLREARDFQVSQSGVEMYDYDADICDDRKVKKQPSTMILLLLACKHAARAYTRRIQSL